MEPESGTTFRSDLQTAVNEFDDTRARLFFIGLAVAPLFPVAEESGTYPIITREHFRKPADTKRAADGSYNRIQGEFGSGTYACEEHGLEYVLDERKARKYATWFSFEQAATRITRHQILLAHERRVAALVFNASTFTERAAAVNWATIATSTPIVDVTTGCETLEDNCGIGRENFSLILPRLEFKYFSNAATVLDRIKYTYPGLMPGQLSKKIIAEILGIKQVLVGGGSYDIKEEGVAESLSQIWPTGHAMLALLGEEGGQGLEEPALARTMQWTADAPENPVVETYRADDRRGDVLRMRDDVDEVLTADADLLGYYIDTST